MASNGEAKEKEEAGSDTVMVDAPSDSPFLLLGRPKMEICDDLPKTTATSALSKPRFEPKVRPRGSRAKERDTRMGQLCQGSETLENPTPSSNSMEADSLRIPKEEHLTKPVASVMGKIQNVKLELEAPDQNVKEETLPLEINESKPKGLIHPGPGLKEEAHVSPKPEEGSVQQELGDRVVREIDVFLSRSVHPDTRLYLLQYPLRPAWRPYGLEERCQEVRVKPKQKKLEVDLAMDTDSENYNQAAEDHLKIETQTLSSSKVSLTASYAIGVLHGNTLHLNPLEAVVQMRPSMRYLDEVDAKKKKAAAAVDDDMEMQDAETAEGVAPELVALQVNVRRRETEWQEENRLHSHAYLKQLDDAEAWIALEPHGLETPVTEEVRHKMMASAKSELSFRLNSGEYVSKLVPGRGTPNSNEVLPEDGSGRAGFSRSFLDTLPLAERFHLLLSKGKVHVLQFERLMRLAPHECTEQEVLNVLQEKAVLVQGCWVVNSSLRYTRPITIIRDYLLLLFTKNRVVHHSQLEDLRLPKENLREILLSFAIQSGITASWEFQESTDKSFIKRHQVVVKEQAQRWMEAERSLRQAVKGLELTSTKRTGSPKIDLSDVIKSAEKKPQTGLSKPAITSERAKGVHFNLPAEDDGSMGPSLNVVRSGGKGSLSEATLAALPRALNKIFLKHNVCSMPFICQTLRQMAIVAAGESSKDASRSLAVEEAKAAAQAAAAPLLELETAVSKIATKIGASYFLSSLGSPSLDPFRNVVIALLRAKGSGSGLRKTDIVEASKIALKCEVPQATYHKVLKELCYTKGGAWVLKAGDGRPA